MAHLGTHAHIDIVTEAHVALFGYPPAYASVYFPSRQWEMKGGPFLDSRR